jgi:hypothetical protein
LPNGDGAAFLVSYILGNMIDNAVISGANAPPAAPLLVRFSPRNCKPW